MTRALVLRKLLALEPADMLDVMIVTGWTWGEVVDAFREARAANWIRSMHRKKGACARYVAVRPDLVFQPGGNLTCRK